MYSKEELYNRIERLIGKGWGSQAAFARNLGVSETTVSNWFSLEREPSLYIVAKICEAYDVTADWLLFGNEEEGAEDA